MKTILIYAQRGSAGYNGFFLSLLREGRIRRWRFAWLTPGDAPDERDRVARLFAFLKPAGFVGTYIRGAAVDVPAGLPAVWVDCGTIPRGAVAVEHDNASFGRAAARTLLGAGAECAAFGLSGHVWSTARVGAFASEVRGNGGRCRLFNFPKKALDNPYLAFEPIRETLLRLPRPVSVFAVTDRLADVTLMAAESLKRRCPDDIRVVGVDDDEVVCMCSPTPLSSVRPDWTEGGRLAAEALETQMRGEKPAKTYLYGAAGVTRRASTREVYRRPRDERVERALSFIASEYASPVGVADVARAMDCSRRLAELRFREETGKTIAEAVEDARLDRVCLLLRRRDADLASIPRLCGFRTASALRAAFRRRTGLSMTAWRAANVPEPGQ